MCVYKSQEYSKNAEVAAHLRAARDSVKARHSLRLAEHHHAHHPIWGQILKTGYQNSRFAHQVCA